MFGQPGGAPNIAENVGGHLASPVAGRTDHLPISVPRGSYIIPADIVSSLGEGNTQAGARLLDSYLPPPGVPGFASGGTAAPMVDIAAAGGEYVVHPDQVAQLGGGDMQHGHDILKSLVKQQRDKTIKTLKGLPGPK